MTHSMETLGELLDWDRAHVLHPIGDFRKHEERGPKIFSRGAGVELFLGDGRRLLDGFSGLFNINIGHGRAEIAEAVAAQMRELAYYPSFWDFGNEPAARLAKRIAGLMPEDRGLNHMLFTAGGSETNEANFRIARLYHQVRGKPSKVKILSRRHAYHGATRGAISATGIQAYHYLADLDPAHVHTAAPYCYRCEFGRSHPGCGLECAEDVERTIQGEGPDGVAALIAEPVMGTGGIIVPPPDYFNRIREICDRHDVLLILDEVITGFGRTGRWFAMEHWGVHPDLLSLAKGISSGYLPLGAAVVSDRVYETLRDGMPRGLPFMFGLTYNNHPACCAAGLANIDIIEREGLVENARVVGAHLRERLEASFGRSPIVGDIRGFGMLAAMEIVRDRQTKEPFSPPGYASGVIARAAFEKGLIVRAMFENLAWSPPLCASKEDIDRMVGILEEVWPETEKKILSRAT